MLLVPGFTFADNVQDQGSALALHNFLASCVITGIAMSNFSTDAHIVQPSATTPSSDQADGSLWFDTTDGLFKVKGDTRWDCPYVGPEMQNNFGFTMPKGTVVVASGVGTMNPCQTAVWPDHLGILTTTCTNTSKAIVQGSGLCLVLVRGPVNYGDVLMSDTLVGYARAMTLSIGYTCGTYGFDIGMCLSSLANNVTGLVTCMAWM